LAKQSTLWKMSLVSPIVFGFFCGDGIFPQCIYIMYMFSVEQVLMPLLSVFSSLYFMFLHEFTTYKQICVIL